MSKVRIDTLLVEKKHFETRQKAQSAILEGIVYIDEVRIDKSGEMVSEDCNIIIRGEKLPFVSRGGIKLDKAIKVFAINVKDYICMDIGASTGGFTDCLLQNQAKFVYAIDVGYGQLAWKLRSDKRVKSLEKTNFRYLDYDIIGEQVDFFCTDVSFISLEKILPKAYEFLKENGTGVCLIKPQFEASKEEVGKKGVIKDKEIHRKVINKIIDFCKTINFKIIGLNYSPIKGPEGNIEFLLYVSKNEKFNEEYDIDKIVEEAHSQL